MSFSSFFFLFCMSGCQKKVIYLVKCVFSFFSVSVPFCLSNKGHLLMSFPSFCFFSICLSNKGHLLMIFPSFRSVRWAGEGGGGWREGGCFWGVEDTSILGQYGYVPYDSLLKTPPFPPGPHRKTPLFKNIHLCVPLFRHGLLQKTPLLKVYVSLLVLVPTPPTPIFSEGPSPRPISNSGRYIYTTFIYKYTPGSVKQRSFK